jgi:hypothetical protein
MVNQGDFGTEQEVIGGTRGQNMMEGMVGAKTRFSFYIDGGVRHEQEQNVRPSPNV